MTLLLSDLDGTLLFDDNLIHDKDLAAIHRFQANGHLFGINTGRTLVGLFHGIESYDLSPDLMIVSSGSQICDKQKNYRMNIRLPRDLMVRVSQEIPYQGKANVLLCNQDHYYHHLNFDEICDQDFDSLHFSFKKVDDLLAIKAMFDTHFQGLLEAHHNVSHLDISPPHTNKGTAVLEACRLFNFPITDVACIGDSFNDLSMMEQCPVSFTFHHCHPLLKEKATYVVSSIAEAIERLEEL